MKKRIVIDGKWKCTKCGEWKLPEQFSRTKTGHIPVGQTQQKHYHRSRCKVCLGLYKKAVYQVKKEEYTHKYRERYAEWRDIIIDGYGGKCECCGELERRFLTIDHVNGLSNRKDRKVGWVLFRQIFLQNFPSEFRILCFNCNLGRQFNGGICPHKESSTTRTQSVAPSGAKRPTPFIRVKI